MNVILLGPPGSGKGTIARLIQDNLGIRHISTGDLLRKEILEGTRLGKQIEPVLASGKLVDNHVVAKVLSKAIIGAKNGFVLDGFPRNSEQARILEKILRETKQKIDLVLELKVNDNAIVQRLSSRRQCEKCHRVYGLNAPPKKSGVCNDDEGKLFQRKDDTPIVIRDRLEIYRKETAPLLKHFSEKTSVEKIDAGKSITEVYKEAAKKISGLGGS